MLTRQRQIRAQFQKLTDAALFALGFWLSHVVRDSWRFQAFWERYDIQPFGAYAWMLLVIIPLTPLVLQIQGFYDRPLLGSRRRALWQLFWASVWIEMLLVLISFVAREQPARAVVLFFGPISFLLVCVKEELMRRWVLSRMGRATFRKRLILAGTPEDLAPMRAKWGDASAEGFEIVAEVDLNHVTLGQLVEKVHEHSVNGVVLNARHTIFGVVEKVIQACELEGVEVWLVADFFQTSISQTVVDQFQGRPVLVFRSAPEESWQAYAKHAIDFVGAGFLLLVLSPLMLGVALVIRLTSGGPVLFRQERSGLNGRPFTMLKFRSMVTNAEQRKHEIAQFNEMSGPVFKVTADPRVTSTGRVLRKFSIDELPQLVNVLRGEMSLVGPRPLPVDETLRFDDLAHRRRLSVKPGLTCLWQIRGRNEVKDFRDWVRLDLEYIDNWSIWLDLKILVRTIPVVLTGAGAK